MHPIINLNMVVEKEIKLERQGFRRTRRYIGDAPALADARWYQTNANRRAENQPFQAAEIPPRQPAAPSFFARLFRRTRLPRPAPGSKCCGETAKCS